MGFPKISWFNGFGDEFLIRGLISLIGPILDPIQDFPN